MLWTPISHKSVIQHLFLIYMFLIFGTLTLIVANMLQFKNRCGIFFSFLKTNADFMIITLKHVQHHDQWVFLTFSHFHEHGFHHFCSLKYPRFLPTHAELFFFLNFLVNWCVGNGNIFDDWYYHWYYHQLFLLHCHCFSIIITVYSKA